MRNFSNFLHLIVAIHYGNRRRAAVTALVTHTPRSALSVIGLADMRRAAMAREWSAENSYLEGAR